MSCPAVIEVVTPGPPGIGLPPGDTEDVGKFLRFRRSDDNPYDYELVEPDEVGLPQALSDSSSPTFTGLTLSGLTAARLVATGTGGVLQGLTLGSGLSIVDGTLVAAGSEGGEYPSLTMPTGFTVSGNSTASLTVAFAAGYSLPTTVEQEAWTAGLSDARTPTAHKASHATGGSDALTPADIGAEVAGAAAAAQSAAISAAAADATAKANAAQAAAIAASAPAAQGVTNGNGHDHSGGDGAQIAYSSLSGLPSLGGAAALNVGTTAGTVAAGNDARLSTNITYDAATREVRSSTGDDAVLPLVTTSAAGLASAGDKQKINIAVVSDATGITGADAVTNIVSLTQAEYNAIASPSATTLYVITD